MELFTGKLDPVFPSNVPLLRDVAMGKMPAVPASVPLPSAPAGGWGMLNNDTEGCCTISGAGHEEMVFKAISGQATLIPGDQQIHTVYRKLTGGEDTGLVIVNVLQEQVKNGLFSTEDELAGGGFAKLDGSILQLHEAVAFFGISKLGIQCPASAQQAAQQQIKTGQVVPWNYVKGSQVEGGHDIEAVAYDDGGVWCISWGLAVYVTYAFLAHYMDESWAPLAKQFRTGSTPMGIDWDSLDSELGLL